MLLISQRPKADPVLKGDSPGDSSLEKISCDLCNTARVYGCVLSPEVFSFIRTITSELLTRKTYPATASSSRPSLEIPPPGWVRDNTYASAYIREHHSILPHMKQKNILGDASIYSNCFSTSVLFSCVKITIASTSACFPHSQRAAVVNSL